MKTISKTLTLAVLVMALMLTACESKPRQGIKGKATDFTLKDLDGKQFRLSDMRGKVVLLDFWATWCPSCVKAIPELVALHEKYRERGFSVVGISMDHSISDAKQFASDRNLPYPVLATDPKVEKQYGVTSIPVTFLIDKNGVVQKKLLGFAPGVLNDLEKDIRLLMEDMPLSQPGGNRD